MDKNQKKIGELLVDAGKVTKQDIEEAQSLKKEGEKIGELLVRLGKITKEDLKEVMDLQKQLEVTGVKKKKFKLGELLIQSGKVTKEQIDKALEMKKGTKEKLGEILVHQGVITQDEINDIVEKQTGIKTIDFDSYIYNGDAYKYIPKNLAQKYLVLPIEIDEKYIKVAMVDPFDIYAVDNVSLYTGLQVIPVFGSKIQIEQKIDELYSNDNVDVAEMRIKKGKDTKQQANLYYDAQNVDGIHVSGSTNIVEDINKSINDDKENVDDIFGYEESGDVNQNINDKQNEMFSNKKKRKRLGEMLVEEGKVTKEQVEMALQVQKKTKQKIGEILVEKGFISQEEVDDAAFRQTGFRSIDLDKYLYTGEAHRLIPERLARKYKVIPLKKEQMNPATCPSPKDPALREPRFLFLAGSSVSPMCGKTDLW